MVDGATGAAQLNEVPSGQTAKNCTLVVGSGSSVSGDSKSRVGFTNSVPCTMEPSAHWCGTVQKAGWDPRFTDNPALPEDRASSSRGSPTTSRSGDFSTSRSLYATPGLRCDCDGGSRRLDFPSPPTPSSSSRSA